MITDYAGLKNAVADQFVTTEIVSFVPTAIGLLEANVNRNVRVRRMIGRATATISGQYTALPSDYLATAGLQINSNPVRKLEFVTIEKMDELKPTYQGSGEPLWFTIIGAEFEVLPVPDDSYTAEVTYYKKLTALSDASTSNWLLANFPDVYFYGALKECANYVRDRWDRPDKRGPLWIERYNAALEEMRIDDDRARFSQGKLVMRPRSVYT